MRTKPRRSKSEIAEAITTAPSSAFGRSAMTGARKKMMAATTAEAISPAACVREPAASLMTVRASLPAAGMPWTRPAAKLAAASPKSSPLALNS